MPKTIGSYRLEALIGRGGMGEVYRAYDQRLDRRVAIKHVRPDSGNPTKAHARLRREARAAARLNHPAIVQIFELIESDAADWIVLELVDGTTLAERLRHGALGLSEVLAFGRQIASGLAEAHGKGIVHRDLKAENVMVTPKGQVKILDFGLAKPLIKGQDDPSLSVRGQVLGTSHAMSPEQARGLEVGPRSDLFSLGSLLYEMATGVAPFRGSNLLDTLARINTHQPPPAAQIVRSLPTAFVDLLARLIEKAPELRPQHAGEVADTLAHIEHQRFLPPISIVGESPTFDAETLDQPRAIKDPHPRRARWLTAALSAAVLLTAGLGLATLVPRFDERPPAQPSAATHGPGAEESLLTAPALYEQGMAYLRRFDHPDNLGRARHSFQRMLALEPDSAAAYAGLARTQWRHYLFGNLEPILLEQAAAAADQAVQLDPYLADARVSRGLVFLYQDRSEMAEEDFREALALEPTLADAHRGLGELHESRGNLERAEESYREAIALEPQNRIFHDDLGALFFKTGRYSAAAEAFRQSIESAPDSIFGYRNLASTYYMEGNLAEAAETLQQALTIRPSATLYSSQGTIFFSQGLYEKAAAAFEQALAIGANKYLHWSNLADAYRWMPDREADARDTYQRATQLLSEQIDAKPEDVTLWSRRALILAKLGQRDGALAELARIAAAGPADAYTHYRVAVTHEVCDQRTAALAGLDRALRAGFALPEVRRDPELLTLRADPRFHRLVMSRAAEEPNDEPQD